MDKLWCVGENNSGGQTTWMILASFYDKDSATWFARELYKTNPVFYGNPFFIFSLTPGESIDMYHPEDLPDFLEIEAQTEGIQGE